MASPSQEKIQELLAAVDKGNVSDVKLILEDPNIEVNRGNKHGESPLHIAAGYGFIHITQILLDRGAFIDIVDKHGDTPLYWAARHGHLDMAQYLINRGATVDMQDKSGETALHVASRYGHPEMVALLCQSRANLDIQDEEGETALHCACWHGYQSIVECLVRSGCSLTLVNKDSEAGLHVAAVRGHYNTVRLLCQAGADLNTQDKNGCVPVHLATRRNHLDIVQYLCSLGAELDITDKLEETPLHDACRDGRLSLVQTLYAAGCNLNLPNKKNRATPLHLAAKYGHIEIVRCLCAADCDLEAVTEQGFFADEVAAGAGHTTTATLLHDLRLNNTRDVYVAELAPASSPLSKVKLLVCGGAGVGKTELVSSLKCSRLRSIFRRRSASDLAHMVANRTYGFDVQQATIPEVGDFSIWDFSGQRDYHVGHEHFLSASNAIFLVVFSLKDPIERQLAQVRHWLAMIRAKQNPGKFPRCLGKGASQPFVVLVGSYADQQQPVLEPVPSETSNGEVFVVPSAASMMNPHIDNGKSVLEAMVVEFGGSFVFPDMVYTLDCRLAQTNEMRILRSCLSHLHSMLIKSHSYVPQLTHSLANALESWRQDHLGLPVLTWKAFHDKVRSTVNPLVSDDQLRDVTNALHKMGEVGGCDVTNALHKMGEVYSIDEGPLKNVVILDPSWLGMRIFGPTLSPENSIIPQVKSVTGRVTLSEIKRVFTQWNALSVVHLLQHFELCHPKDEAAGVYEFPCLIKMQSVFGLWERDPLMMVYAGIRIAAARSIDMLTAGTFPRVQTRLQRVFNEGYDDQELTIWSEGLKCCRGEVEILVCLSEVHRSIDIKVRGSSESRQECYSLLQQFYSVVQLAVADCVPGADIVTHILSVKRLKEHQPLLCYHPWQIFKAQREDGLVVHPEDESLQENILDLLCCGCQELLLAATSVPHLPSSTLPLKTRLQVCQMLDPPHPLGLDWCIFALTLGLVDDLPAIDQSSDHSSSTQRVLSFWENGSQSSLAKMVDSLTQIGRHDVAEVLIEGISLFPSSNSYLVLSLPGVDATTYVC